MQGWEARKEACKGWQSRVRAKLAFAGGTGLVVGSMLAVMHNVPVVRNTATSTASFLIVMGCFSALQETVRFLQAADTPINSAVAGAGTGGFLYKLNGARPATGAAICAAVGGAVHWATGQVDMSQGLRGALVSLDLLDPIPEEQQQQAKPPAGASAGAAGNSSSAAGSGGGLWDLLLPYLPVKKYTDEEWEEYKREQEEKQRKRIEAALEGGLPAMVDRQRQHGQQPEAQQPAAGSKGGKGQ